MGGLPCFLYSNGGGGVEGEGAAVCVLENKPRTLEILLLKRSVCVFVLHSEKLEKGLKKPQEMCVRSPDKC